MQNNECDYKNELNISVNMVLVAGKILQESFFSATTVNIDPNKAPIDRIVESKIVDCIKNHFPEDFILGEETGGSNAYTGKKKRLWIIDPNDGTYFYSKNIPGSAISLALVDDSELVMGVVYAYNSLSPLGDMFHWRKGDALYRNGKKHQNNQNGKRIALVPHNEDPANAGKFNIRSIEQTTMISPSIAYRLALVAVGEADFTFDFGSPDIWDLAGGHALLRAHGLSIFDDQLNEITYEHLDKTVPPDRVFAGGKEFIKDFIENTQALYND